MYKFLQDNRGTVTILLSLILIPILSLSSLMMELGRAVSAKSLVKEAEKSSIMSLMSYYEKSLLEDYGVTGVYYTDANELNRIFLEYMNYNSDNVGDNATAFSSVYKVEDTEVSGVYNLANYSVLMHSLIENGKYTEAYALADEFLNFSSLLDKLAEAFGVPDIQNMINQFADKLDKVADVADMINKLNDVKNKSTELVKTFEDLGEKVNGVGTALNKKADFISKYGKNGQAPPKPDSTAKDDTYYLYKALESIKKNVDTTDESFDKELDSTSISYVEHFISTTNVYTDDPMQTKHTITYEQALDAISSQMTKYKIDVFSPWNKSNVEKSYKSAKSVYESQNKKFDSENSKYTKYYNEIGSYNDDITEACRNVALEVDNVSSKLTDYSTSLNDALSAINKVNTDVNGTDQDISQEISSTISKLQEKNTSGVTEITNALSTIKSTFNNIDGSGVVSTIKNTIKNAISSIDWNNVKESVKSYLIKWIIESADLETIIKELNDTKNWLGDILNFIKGLKDVVKVLKPWPDVSNNEFNTVMSNSNMAITLKNTNSNGLNSTLSNSINNDISEINNKITTGNVISRRFGLMPLNQVLSPSATISNEISIINDFENLANSVKTLFTNMFDNDKDIGLISIVCDILSGQILEDLKTVFQSFIILISRLASLALDLVQSAYDNLMLAQYARMHFNNRLSENKIEYDGNSTYQLFKNAEQEYIIIGKESEKGNQTAISMIIFAYRLLNNIVAVLKDSTAMGVISACNVFAPLVFIVWVYFETCLDVNCLMANIKVGLFKQNLWISPTSLTKIAENTSKLESGDTPSQTIQKLLGGVTGSGFDYSDYLTFFLVLTTNKTKAMRIGDLIQWHIRYNTRKNFLLKNTYCMFRTTATVSLNPMLPIVNLSNSSSIGLTNRTQITQVSYEGY